MSAPFVNTRVKVVGTSKVDLNDQEGVAVSYSAEAMRYTVLLDNGRSVALKVANLVPVGEPGEARASSTGSGTWFPGAAGAGIPSMDQLISVLPGWLRDKVLRGEIPSIDDLSRIFPPGVTATHVGCVGILFLLMLFKFGMLRTLLLFSILGFIFYSGFAAFSRAGGGLSGITCAATEIGERLSRYIHTSTQRHIAPNLALGGLGAALLAVMYFMFTGDNAPHISGSVLSSPRFDAEEAYIRGYDDAVAGRPLQWSSHAQDFSATETSYNIPPNSYNPGPSRNQSLFGGFGFGKLITLGILAKQIYSLGAIPGAGWDINYARANLMNMSAMQKGFMALMVLRLVGMSPI